MKGAIEVLTRYMAEELGARKITANVIAPGAIATVFSGGMVRDNPQVNRTAASMTALGRVGLSDDGGGAVAMHHRGISVTTQLLIATSRR
jgi:NAD(P)-dependent dehydrogenase (short-subunit alcohol dehydrogenase family)